MAGHTVVHALSSKGLYKTVQLIPATKELLTRGTQIVYVPTHADGHLLHPDTEAGFVTSVSLTFAFCRYWFKDRPTRDTNDLRTRGNSEPTNFEDLYIVDTVSQELVENALEKHC